MNKFNGDVLRVRRIRPAPKGEQPATLKEPLGHFTARLCQATSFHSEKGVEHSIACKQSLLNLCGEFEGRHDTS
jgi:hypothetical protein